MESRMREIRTYGLTRGKSHWWQRRGEGLYATKIIALSVIPSEHQQYCCLRLHPTSTDDANSTVSFDLHDRLDGVS